VDEDEPGERVIGSLDRPVHVDAALAAGMANDQCARVDGPKLVGVFHHLYLLARYDRDLREKRTLRFPSLRATAYVVVRALSHDRNFDGVRGAPAAQRAAAEILCGGLDAVVDGRMNCDLGHVRNPPFSVYRRSAS